MKTALKFATFIYFCFACLPVSAQTASTICLDEVKAAWATVDQDVFFGGEKVFRADYTFTYQLQSNPNDKPVVMEESFLCGQSNAQQINPDMEIYSTQSEAYVYRPQQMMIYQVGPQIKDLRMFSRADAGLLNYCTVTQCEFLRGTGADTVLKEFKIVVNAEGQAKYKISSLVILADPVKHTLKKIKFVYTEGAKYVFADYKLNQVNHDAFPGAKIPSPRSYFYDESNNLLPRFGGVRFMDMRN